MKTNLPSTNTWFQTSRRLIQEPQISTMKGIYGRRNNSKTQIQESESITQSYSFSIVHYDNHSAIHIDGNADFATQAINESWIGDGTL